MLTYERATEILSYNELTGELRWKVQLSNRAPKGSIAGSLNKKENRCRIKIDGELYYSHRIIWLLMTKSWPLNEVDHKDRNGRNNVWTNLRDLTHQKNVFNRLEVGAHLDTNKRWTARLQFEGKVVLNQKCGSEEEAKTAYLQAKQVILESL
jgi:hypothetical protein